MNKRMLNFRDADWETEPNAFEDLSERPNSCEAKTCKCPDGRKYDTPDVLAEFTLLHCDYCGSHCVHRSCTEQSEFLCGECLEFDRRNQPPDAEIAEIAKSANNSHNDNDSNDGHAKCSDSGFSSNASENSNELVRPHKIEDEQIISIDSSSEDSFDQRCTEDRGDRSVGRIRTNGAYSSGSYETETISLDPRSANSSFMIDRMVSDIDSDSTDDSERDLVEHLSKRFQKRSTVTSDSGTESGEQGKMFMPQHQRKRRRLMSDLNENIDGHPIAADQASGKNKAKNDQKMTNNIKTVLSDTINIYE